MSLTPGYILTDEYGDMIGLTTLEMHVVAQAYAMGPAPDITIKGSWPRLHVRWIGTNGGHDMLVSHVKEHDGEGDTVIVSERDVAAMRDALDAAQDIRAELRDSAVRAVIADMRRVFEVSAKGGMSAPYTGPLAGVLHMPSVQRDVGEWLRLLAEYTPEAQGAA